MSTRKFLSPTYIKVDFFKSLKDIVLAEIESYSDLQLLDSVAPDFVTLDCASNFKSIKNLKSVLRASLVRRGTHLNPYYLSNHKSLLGDLIFTALHESPKEFTTYKISCAGSDSKATQALKRFVEDTYKLTESTSSNTADLKIIIARTGRDWELSVSITPRPLSVRTYKIHHTEGGINPTIAYAMNFLGNINRVKSYLNIFCGSGTLLIEATLQTHKKTGIDANKSAKINVIQYVGFDHSKEAATVAIRNIQHAGFIKDITIKVADIYTRPDFGTFDLITADLPFGMKISKGNTIPHLYSEFIAYAEHHITEYGTLVVYTSELTTFTAAVKKSKFTEVDTREIMITTSVNSHLPTYIIVCKLKR